MLVLTVKDTTWTDGFAARLAALAAAGAIRPLEQTEPYVSMPGQPATVPSRAIALARL